MSKETTKAFFDRVEESLADPHKRKTMARVQDGFKIKKQIVFDELGNLDDWKHEAAEIKQHTIEWLDTYLAEFADKIEGLGGHVYFAQTAEEATNYVVNLAREKQVKTVVKSKSMVTEEIGLNEALEQAGVEPIETDLGEYIVQVAHEKPYHIVVPAIHKTRQDIADLFSSLSGKHFEPDTHELAEYARQTMRPHFFEAEMGISGCNFGVAETGTVVLVTNEGNARLTTTFPKTHVVVMGMERLVPRMRDLDAMLELLPRHATGQRTISYITAITGPRRPGEVDGPEDLHVVIVDNGRSNLLESEYDEALRCIRCGNCYNVCPVNRNIGGHAYGGTYAGPIGSILMPMLTDLDSWKELPSACTLCGACTEACPVEIPLHHYLLKLRRDIVDETGSSFAERSVFKFYGKVAGNPKLYDKSVKMAGKVARTVLGKKTTRIKKAPSAMGKWTESRDLPMPAEQSFREWWEKEGSKQ